MGLAAPKNRTRISNDPQNTHWAGNTSRFGHRILTSQGWTPGSSLGAKDAAHSAHYTVASHSHIRVLLKEDNLGLGAKRGSERAENFGLAGLESVLGRLNGNEEEVKKEEARREEIEKRAYVYRKFGFMNFVSGGYLVGDKIEKTIKKEEVGIKAEPQSDSETTAKKRKRDDKDTPEIKDEDSEEPKLKRKKKSMNLREEAAKEGASKSKKERKDKKDKSKKDKKKDKKDKKSTTSDPEPDSTSDTPTPASDPEPLTEKARRKAEKRVRKEEKKLKKALKKAAKKAAKSKSENSDASSESEDEETSSSAPISTAATGTSTPIVSAVGLTFGAGGRHAVRQRYIRQKKMASMDPQALKEIFMIKTPS